MKKRIVSIIVVMMLLVSMLSGCGLITLNAERDGAQVVSEVKVAYGTGADEYMEGVVTKADLVGFFNQVGYVYIQYYGWTPEKVINEFAKQLTNKEILVLHATKTIATSAEYKDKVDMNKVRDANNKYVDYLRSKGTNKYKDQAVRPYDLFELMRPDEQLYVKKQAKKSMKESYDALVKEVEAEFEANAPEAEEEDTDKEEDKVEEDKKTLEPRPQKDKPATQDKYEKQINITQEAADSEKTFFEEMKTKVDADELTEVEIEAYNRLKRTLIKNYDSVENAWNSVLDGQKEARLLAKFQDEYVNKDVDVKVEDIISRYNYTISNDLVTVFDEASYKTAFEADKDHNLLVHNNKTGYFTIKSILLQFSEDQKKALEAIKAGALGDPDDKQAIAELRDELATNDAFDVPGFAKGIGGIEVNKSNPNYDPNAICKVKDCPCKACENNKNYKKDNVCTEQGCPCVECKNNAYEKEPVAFGKVIDELSLAIAKSKDMVFPEGMDDATKAKAITNARMDTFDDYIYLVNDDPGMFNSAGYTANTKGESSFVGEYVTLARELINKANADKKSAVGMVGGIEAKDYENAINKDAAKVHIYSAKAADGDDINYIVNDFGIHIVMVTYVAAEDTREGIKEEDRLTTKADADGQYRLSLDYVVKYENVYEMKDGKVVLQDGKKVLKKVANKTVRDKIYDTILEEKKADHYADEEKKISENEDYKKGITTHDNIIKGIIKDIEKALGDAGHSHGHEGHNH